MSNLFSGINARLRGTTGRVGGSARSPTTPTAESSLPSPTVIQSSQSSDALPMAVPSLPAQSSPNIPSSATAPNLAGTMTSNFPRPLPLWLNPAYAKHIVKGNFMTLSARPKTVEQGEWIAHQVVEHYRILWNFVRLVYEKEKDGNSICNPSTCPKMSAGRNHSYTWLNSRFEPIELPAREYISLMQRWISGKIDDTAIFPTDPSSVSFANNPALSSSTPVPFQLNDSDDWVGKSSGFPKEFLSVCKTIFLQMFRVYAHLYWDHFVEPFYHLNLEKQLNSCFSHFILTATALNMLRPEDIEPMQLLVDLWAANGTFPPESKAYTFANLESGTRLMQGNES